MNATARQTGTREQCNSAGNGVHERSPASLDALGKVERSIAYMREHLDKPLQVAMLAALAKVSPSHYFALFKRCTGSAPIDYFVRLRMERACEFLDNTKINLSIKETAGALGYEDPFHFSRVFKSVVGVSPNIYRSFVQNGRNQRAGISKTAISGLNDSDRGIHVSNEQVWSQGPICDRVGGFNNPVGQSLPA